MNQPIENDLRLIEAGFPCHQVGVETQRERTRTGSCASSALKSGWLKSMGCHGPSPGRSFIKALFNPSVVAGVPHC